MWVQIQFSIFQLLVKYFAVFIFSLKEMLKATTNEIEFNQTLGAKTRLQAFQTTRPHYIRRRIPSPDPSRLHRGFLDPPLCTNRKKIIVQFKIIFINHFSVSTFPRSLFHTALFIFYMYIYMYIYPLKCFGISAESIRSFITEWRTSNNWPQPIFLFSPGSRRGMPLLCLPSIRNTSQLSFRQPIRYSLPTLCAIYLLIICAIV